MAVGGPQGSVDGQERTRNESAASLLAQTAAEPLSDVPADASDEEVIDDVVLYGAPVLAKTVTDIQMGAAKATP